MVFFFLKEFWAVSYLSDFALKYQVMVKRQRTAFPPNFVHSLDSTHMMMTAIACKKAGLTFAGESSVIGLSKVLY